MKTTLYALVIGASSLSIHAINEAKKLGFTVIAFDGDPKAEGLNHADNHYVLDIREPSLIIKKLEELQIVPDIVLPIPIGRYLITTGAINDHYKLKGVNYAGADLCTDKFEFHNLLYKNNLRNVNCELIKANDTSIAMDKIKKHPAIVKPRYGSGSRMVFVVNNYEELKKQFIDKMPYDEDFIVEDVISGTEYGMDAAIINGEFHLILLREKILTPFPYCQCVGYYSVNKNQDTQILFDRLNTFILDVIQVIKLNNVLFHADLIYDGNEYFLIEISARPSGHNLNDVFVPLATDIYMSREFIKFAVPKLHENYSFVPEIKKPMLIRYFDFENCKVVSVPDKNILMKKYPLLQFQYNDTNRIMGKVQDGQSIMGRGFFILEGNNKKELEQYSKNVLGEFVLESL